MNLLGFFSVIYSALVKGAELLWALLSLYSNAHNQIDAPTTFLQLIYLFTLYLHIQLIHKIGYVIAFLFFTVWLLRDLLEIFGRGKQWGFLLKFQ